MVKNSNEECRCDARISEPVCLTMDKAGVPRDFRWRSLILYMRSLEEYSYLTDRQKAALQDLVVTTLKKKDFTEERYQDLIAKKEQILYTAHNKKIRNALKETAELVADFRRVLGKRRGDVQELGEFTIDSIEQGKDTDTLIKELKKSFKEVISAMEEDITTLNQLSRTDSLTGISNRRAFDEYLERAVRDWSEKGTSLHLLLLDIDHFKEFNDKYGHRIGDQALMAVAKHIEAVGLEFSAATGGRYFVARFGGEEFTVVMSAVDQETAMEWAEVIRRRIEEYHFVIRDNNGEVLRRDITLSVSIGVAEMMEHWRGALEANLIDAADRAMYEAKKEGRNLVLPYTYAKAEDGLGEPCV